MVNNGSKLNYLQKKSRSKEIVKCIYCDKHIQRNSLKKHISLIHNDEKKITTNFINKLDIV